MPSRRQFIGFSAVVAAGVVGVLGEPAAEADAAPAAARRRMHAPWHPATWSALKGRSIRVTDAAGVTSRWRVIGVDVVPTPRGFSGHAFTVRFATPRRIETDGLVRFHRTAAVGLTANATAADGHATMVVNRALPAR